MKIKFITRQEFESLQGVAKKSLSDSGQCHSPIHHANGTNRDDRIKQIHDYGYATGIRDCVSVAVIPNDRTKQVNLLHFNTVHFLDNFKLIDSFIRKDLNPQDLQQSSALVLGSLAQKAEFGPDYSKKQIESERLLQQVHSVLENTGASISEFTGQIARLNPLAACESHIYVDRTNDTVYICADYLNVPFDTNGNIVLKDGKIDEATLIPEGGVNALDKLKQFFSKFKLAETSIIE